MHSMEVKIKLLDKNACVPLKAHESDAGFDLYATSRVFDEKGNAVYGTGIAMEIPKGYVGLLFPRSSISRTDLSLTNAVGVVDSGYRGEIYFKFRPTLAFMDDTLGENDTDYDGEINQSYDFVDFYGRAPHSEDEYAIFRSRLYEVGERIGQIIIIPIPEIEFVTASALSSSERGEEGFGSSGK